MERFDFEHGSSCVVPAWTLPEIRSAIGELMAAYEQLLPADRDAAVLIKPNLNNDLVALTGNSADLRVLACIIEELQRRGFGNITLADGSNVGVDRRGIDTFKRLRIDRLAQRYGVRLVDLNHDDGEIVVLHGGGHPHIARTVLDADFYIAVPKIKTHVEAGLSCALKNQVGIARGQDKRHMHYDLSRNIFALGEVVVPDLIIVDGLVGMEGNGPGDGDPFRFGHLIASDDPFVNDVVVCRLVGLPWDAVGYLCHAHDAGRIDDALIDAVGERVPVVRTIQAAPKRGRLAELADVRALQWLKVAARPITERPAVTKAAYGLGVIQDVYNRSDDRVERVVRDPDACGTCEKCADFCPTGLSAEEIGVKTDPEDCIGCLYCWWVCPNEALALDGPLEHLERQVERYKSVIEQL